MYTLMYEHVYLYTNTNAKTPDDVEKAFTMGAEGMCIRYIYMYMYIYIYLYTYKLYIYTYMYIYTYICIYIYDVEKAFTMGAEGRNCAHN
jgi:hypothetical protein